MTLKGNGHMQQFYLLTLKIKKNIIPVIGGSAEVHLLWNVSMVKFDHWLE